VPDVDLAEALLLLLGFGGLFAWPRLRGRRQSRRYEEFLATLDADAELAVHLATHEAKQRAQAFCALHLVHGLLQNEGFVAAIAGLGGDAEATEHRVFLALEKAAPDHRATLEVGGVLARASASAQGAGRRASCTDLWYWLAKTDTAKLVEAGSVTRDALTFALVHGRPEPSASHPSGAEVEVALLNDDYTTQEFVVELLRDVFGLPSPAATTLMMAVHEQGRGVVGRFGSVEARRKVDAARALARARGFPLWIGAERVG
jgi:ATP-dependent Clp protease adaptor protein ClpS